MKQLAEITKDCLDLPSAQRFKLARILIDVSEPAGEFSPDTESAWDEEIAARAEAVKNGSARSRPVGEAFSEIDARYPGFPYYIAYIIHDQTIWILSIAHAARRPEYWIARNIPGIAS